MTLDDVRQFLVMNPWALLILAACTVVGVPLGIWGLTVSLRGIRVRRPTYATRTTSIVRDLKSVIPDVEVSHKGYGSTVENLTVTKILFLNRGREAIRKDDIPRMEPLRIKMSQGAIILGVTLLYHKSVNQFSVGRSADRTTATITFSYLDFWDGAVIQVVHTGTSDRDVEVEGMVIGDGHPKRMGVGFSRPAAYAIGYSTLLLMIAFVTLGWAPQRTAFDYIGGWWIFLLIVPTFLWSQWERATRLPLRPTRRYLPYRTFWD